MQKEFEEASFNLKPGEISQVVQTASGLHLIERYVSRSLIETTEPRYRVACGAFPYPNAANLYHVLSCTEPREFR